MRWARAAPGQNLTQYAQYTYSGKLWQEFGCSDYSRSIEYLLVYYTLYINLLQLSMKTLAEGAIFEPKYVCIYLIRFNREVYKAIKNPF